MRKCFVVIHHNFVEGLNAYAFFNEEDAKKSVSADAETVLDALKKQGYESAKLDNAWNSKEVYVPDTDIYYSWTIIHSDIQ